MEWGSDVNRPDKYGSTALKIADFECHKRVMDVLIAGGGSMAATEHVSAFETLVQSTGIGTTEHKQKQTKKSSFAKQKFTDAASKAFAAPVKRWDPDEDEDELPESFWDNPIKKDKSTNDRFLDSGL